jgi:hypothetical protein
MNPDEWSNASVPEEGSDGQNLQRFQIMRILRLQGGDALVVGYMTWEQGLTEFPSLAKEGCREAAGWFVKTTAEFLERHHPVCAVQMWLRSIFQMAQPPLLCQGGLCTTGHVVGHFLL